MAILFIENGYLFMKNFSTVSYQTGSQALTAILNVATNIAVLFTVHYKPVVAYKLPWVVRVITESLHHY